MWSKSHYIGVNLRELDLLQPIKIAFVVDSEVAMDLFRLRSLTLDMLSLTFQSCNVLVFEFCPNYKKNSYISKYLNTILHLSFLVLHKSCRYGNLTYSGYVLYVFTACASKN